MQSKDLFCAWLRENKSALPFMATHHPPPSATVKQKKRYSSMHIDTQKEKGTDIKTPARLRIGFVPTWGTRGPHYDMVCGSCETFGSERVGVGWSSQQKQSNHSPGRSSILLMPTYTFSKLNCFLTNEPRNNCTQLEKKKKTAMHSKVNKQTNADVGEVNRKLTACRDLDRQVRRFVILKCND